MRLIVLLVLVFIGFIVLLVVEGFIARSGPKESFKNPERKVRRFGNSNNKIKYMVMGDSTGAGQGADYEKGIAVRTAEHLARTYSVNLLNASVSGAKVKDILNDQIKEVKKYKPDVILVSIGANDVTGLTLPQQLQSQLDEMVDELIETNCNMKIVLTASPDMGSPPRLPQPLRFVEGIFSKFANSTFYSIIEENNLTLAPIAEETGDIFRKDATLFSQDQFHPNEQGYAVWTKVLNPALDKAMKDQVSHCVR